MQSIVGVSIAVCILMLLIAGFEMLWVCWSLTAIVVYRQWNEVQNLRLEMLHVGNNPDMVREFHRRNPIESENSKIT